MVGRVGLCTTIEYALEWGQEAIYARIQMLAGELRARLMDITGVQVRDLGFETCGIESFTKTGVDADKIKEQLQVDAINVSTSSKSSTLLDMQEMGIASIVRARVHYYNSEEELERFTDAISDIG